MLTWLIEKLPTVRRLRKSRDKLVDECVRLDVSLKRAEHRYEHMKNCYRAELVRKFKAEGLDESAAQDRASVTITATQWMFAKGKEAVYGEQIPLPAGVDINKYLGDALAEARRRGQGVKP